MKSISIFVLLIYWSIILLAPVISKQNKIDLPVCILNIGGVANLTIVTSHEVNNLKSYDIGPGNCLIDDWIR